MVYFIQSENCQQLWTSRVYVENDAFCMSGDTETLRLPLPHPHLHREEELEAAVLEEGGMKGGREAADEEASSVKLDTKHLSKHGNGYLAL